MPDLEDLLTEEVRALALHFDALLEADRVLRHAGYFPLYNAKLSRQGCAFSIHFPADMPLQDAPARDDAPYAWSPETGVMPIGRPLAADPPPPYPPRPTPSPPPEPADDAPPATDATGAGGVAPEPEETEEVPPAGEDPAGEPAGPQPEQTAASAGAGPAAGGEGADLAATPPAAIHPNAWTEDQDDQLIEGVALALLEGKSFTAAAHSMADPLGRTKQACWFRAHSKFRDRIEARLAELGQPSAPPPAAPKADDRSLLQRYLDDLPPTRDWSIGKDADLLRLAIAGMGLEDIAVEMDLRAADVRARFDLLTGHHKIEEGERSTWRRRFTREDVLAELEARLPQAAE